MTRRGRIEYTSVWHILFLVLALLSAGVVWAQDDDEQESAELDRIAVTGSRIKRSDIEGPAQVITIDSAQMAERGYSTVFEALKDLTVNNGFVFEGPESQLFTPDVQTLNIRGFGVGTTLVLINGRRLTNYPAAYQSNATVFSFGSIPVSAVERIEVLAQGASAIYGSDAVSGVINVILRSDIDETTVNVLWGSPTESKSTRGETRIQLLNGKNFDRGSYTFTLEYLNRDGITGSDFSEYDDQQDDYPYGEGVYNRSILTLDWFKNAFGIAPYYRDPGAILGTTGPEACASANPDLVYAYRSANDAGYFCGDPNQGVASVNFRNQRESWSAYFNGKVEIGDGGTELFTDVLYYKSRAKAKNDFIFISEDILDLTQPDTVDFGFYDWYLAQRFFTSTDTGRDLDPRFEDEAWTAVVGARGIFADVHDWEISVNYSEYQYDSEMAWFKTQNVIDDLLGIWHGISFFGTDWWSGGTLGEGLGFGLGNPENLYGQPNQALRDAIGNQTYSNKSEDWFAQFTMSGDLFEMPAGPLSYAFVAEYEDTKIKYIPDELVTQLGPFFDVEGTEIQGLTSTGWWRLTGYTGDGDRQRWALGAELRIPLLPSLTLNLAGRYDDYDKTSTSQGGDFTPSASIEFRPFSNLLLRGGYTESFRAPDLAQVFVNTGSFQTGFDYIQCYDTYVFTNGSAEGFDTGDCDTTSIFTQRIGAQEVGLEPLDSETGRNWWIGFSWDIVDNLNVTVDYTNMRLEDRTITQSTQGLLNDEYECFTGELTGEECTIAAAQIQRGVDPTTGIRFIQNFYRTAINQYEEEAEFIDAQVTYTLSTEAGIFSFQGNYTNVLDHTQKLTATSEPFDVINDPRNFGADDFRSSFIGSLSWSYRDFATTLTAIYRGRTTVYECFNQTNSCTGNLTGEDYYETGDFRVDSYTTYNLTVAYNFTDQLLARLRVINLFDKEPPKDDTFQFYQQPWYNTFMYSGAGIGRWAGLEVEYTF